MTRAEGCGAYFALQEHAHGNGGGERRDVPVAKEVNTIIVAAACTGEGKVETCQGRLHEIFVVSADIDCGTWGKVGSFGVSDECREGVVLVRARGD